MRVQVPPPAPRFARAVAPASLTVSHRLKGLTVEVRAGNAIRKYKVVKSDGPDDLVFQGVQSGGPLRDSNNILVRFIKPAARSMEGLKLPTAASSRAGVRNRRIGGIRFERGEKGSYNAAGSIPPPPPLRLVPVFILARLNVGGAAVGDWNFEKILKRWQDVFEPALPTDRSQTALRYVLAVLTSIAALLLRKTVVLLLGDHNADHVAWLAVVFSAWYRSPAMKTLTQRFQTATRPPQSPP